MSNKLSIVIMAHRDREAMALQLAFNLGGVPIVWDLKNDIWDTCRRSWQAIDKSKEYGLVLHDDSVVCKDFIERAEACLTDRFVYKFFIPPIFAERVKEAQAKGENAFYMSSLSSIGAMCLSTKYIDSMIKYCDDHGAKNEHLISSWIRLRKMKVCYPIPSLADHRPGESIYLKRAGKLQRAGDHQSCCFADNENL